ncbi:hypothetical protein M422DRAFT_268240 [Sphaerobolus stellatus SS14]|uniref:Uncharacterized protein n=1 Tax=Sphaerobolus stellatus (strain SS14) TaxID=990650 RepID=A0A0C9UYP4_SPHS4|nr:hypothetical protein M422DRAFT_268240 [Sphaerobolus stellatus SS14]
MSGPDTPKLFHKILKKIRASLSSVLAPKIASSHVDFFGGFDGDRDGRRARDSSNDDGGVYLSDNYENKVDYAGQDGDAEDGDGEGEEGPLAPGIYLAYSISNLKGLWRREEEAASTATAGAGEKNEESATEEYALVPESYLKFVRGDDEEDREDEWFCIYLHVSIALALLGVAGFESYSYSNSASFFLVLCLGLSLCHLGVWGTVGTSN